MTENHVDDYPPLPLAGYMPERDCMAKGCLEIAAWDVAVQHEHDVTYGTQLCGEHARRGEPASALVTDLIQKIA